MITATSTSVGRWVVYCDGAPVPTVDAGLIRRIGGDGTVFVAFLLRNFDNAIVKGCSPAMLYWLDAFPDLLAAAKKAIHCLTAETEEEWSRSQAYDEAPYHFLYSAIAKAGDNKGG
jgi:hypothetical protein